MTSAEFSYELKIPKERVAVLIGTKGEIKKQVEQATKTKINIDSAEGDVTITGKDALQLFTAREIVLAIGRGFNPDVAKLLLKQDYGMEVITLTGYARNKEDMIRLKGRVIGEEGKSRKYIEELTDVRISVYGKTICLLGSFETIQIARIAVEMLLQGSTHSTVYHYLEKKKKEMKHQWLQNPLQ